LKQLFALSQNQCAFPSCLRALVDGDAVKGEVCHIKARKPGGPRFDASQSDSERHAFANLVLMCAEHHKTIDSASEVYTVERIQSIKQEHNSRGSREITPSDAHNAQLILNSYLAHIDAAGPVTVNAQTANFNTPKSKIEMTPPAGSIAAELSRRNYVQHLIERYQKFAKGQPSREFRYPAIYEAVKREFGAKWDLVSVARFDDLVAYLQDRINQTRQGKINKGKSVRNYSTYEEYRTKYEKVI
jgi:hypothetical protein